MFKVLTTRLISTVFCLSSVQTFAQSFDPQGFDPKGIEVETTDEAASSGNSLSDIKGIESSRDKTNSPTQVVILNNSPSNAQEQTNTQKTKSSARSGWGTGESLDAVREYRMKTEAKNEQALMEKLEASRVEDEKSRLNRLFKVRQYNQSAEVPTYVPQAKVNHVQDVYANTKHSAATSTETYNSSSSALTSFYFKGQYGAGFYNYENTDVSHGYILGAGLKFYDRLHGEFNFISSNYRINDPLGNYEYAHHSQVFENSNLRDMNQRNFSGVLGYDIYSTEQMKAAFRAGLSYVQRDSESARTRGFSKQSTDALDAVVGASVDFKVAKNLYVTGAFDYYLNLDNNVFEVKHKDIVSIEVANYFVTGVGLKLEF
jgi:hypothetical protein